MLIFACQLLGGCALTSSDQAKLDQVELRDALMDYAEDQIMDNLIRAKNGLPIVHYDFTNASATVTTKLSGNIGGGETLTDSPTTRDGMGTIIQVAARTATRPFSWSLTPERNNAIDITVNPIVKERQIYEAYVAFLNTDLKGSEIGKNDSVVSTDYEIHGGNVNGKKPPDKPNNDAKYRTTTEKTTWETNTAIVNTTTPEIPPAATKADPPSGVTIITRQSALSVNFNKIHSIVDSERAPDPSEVLFGERQWHRGNWRYGAKKWRDGRYYWIPKEYKSAFFRLCLATVARSYASPGTIPASGGGESSPSAGADSAPVGAAFEQLKNSFNEISSQQRQQNLR